MKIAVYSIAKNEEKFVKTWYESSKEADYLLIADTGSTDKTVELAKSLGIVCHTISISPWRFDDARNASLSLIPADIDYCIALDLDEVLIPGWRQELERATTTRPRYQYTWNWNADGSPGLQYGGDKIHARHGYRWKHPVHEVLTPDRIEQTEEWLKLEIHHHADNSKPRSQYMPLLAQSVQEDPYDDRNAFYYARELFFYGQYEKAEAEFKRHLELPRAVWKPERAAGMRYLGNIATTFKDKEGWFIKAAEEAPDRREAWVELAKLYYENSRWVNCYLAAENALFIEEKPLEYLCEDWAWGFQPWDYAAIAHYQLSISIDEEDRAKYHRDMAVKFGSKAVELGPNEPRLKTNLEFYLKEPSVGNNL